MVSPFPPAVPSLGPGRPFLVLRRRGRRRRRTPVRLNVERVTEQISVPPRVLVHALHNQSGVAVNDENEADRRVIGIGPYLKCPVTENAYRNAATCP